MIAIRIAVGSLWSAARQLRTIGLAWLLVTLPALFLVLPVYGELRAVFDHHPGATWALDQYLDPDFARGHPAAVVRGSGALLLVLLGWAFLGGGILVADGTGGRIRTAEFFAACGRHLLANLRALGCGLVVCLLLCWGIGVLDGWLRNEVLADADPGMAWQPFGLQSRWLTVESGLVALRWGYGFLFLLLLFASKLARVYLCVGGRHSAVLAWLRALLRLLRHPLRAMLVVAVLSAVPLLLQFAVAELLAMAPVGDDLWWLLLGSQLHVVVLQIVLIANFHAARRCAGTAALATAVGVAPPVNFVSIVPGRRPSRAVS
ncbi:MAG TPA: hypothetical protein VK348_07250 [Planctomycetota bacterium]|nr:hypothetical protein [Planctomycetota bacterium]